MKTERRLRASALFAGWCLFMSGSPADSAVAASAQAKTAKPAVSPQARLMLHEMSAYLKAAPQLSFHADITYDDFLASGQKVELSASYDAAVRRPDRVYTEYAGEAGSRRFWYDGKSFTLYEPRRNLYATAKAASSIDAAIPQLTRELGFTPPLSDLMTGDPEAFLTKDVRYGLSLGETSIGGVRCHHLAFVGSNVDWQVWIEDGTQWVPRKLVITYKKLAGAPQFRAILSGWDFSTRPPDALFRAHLPAGAAQIPFGKVSLVGKPAAQGGNAK
jgi:hypothetical protein